MGRRSCSGAGDYRKADRGSPSTPAWALSFAMGAKNRQDVGAVPLGGRFHPPAARTLTGEERFQRLGRETMARRWVTPGFAMRYSADPVLPGLAGAAVKGPRARGGGSGICRGKNKRAILSLARDSS